MICAHNAAPDAASQENRNRDCTLARAQQRVDDPDSDEDSSARISSVVDHASRSNAPFFPGVGDVFRGPAQERPDSIHPDHRQSYEKTGNHINQGVHSCGYTTGGHQHGPGAP
jgi:hypothetical protein